MRFKKMQNGDIVSLETVIQATLIEDEGGLVECANKTAEQTADMLSRLLSTLSSTGILTDQQILDIIQHNNYMYQLQDL